MKLIRIVQTYFFEDYLSVKWKQIRIIVQSRRYNAASRDRGQRNIIKHIDRACATPQTKVMQEKEI